jgi:NADH dehydrogenase [ubiquinone] 1 alpha subcomplex assembly factor 6
MAEALSYCAAEVRRWDYDRYLAGLFAPAAARERLFALYAFNHEIAKVRETVREPMLGQIRLQWWREAIAGIYEGKIRKHPVVEALACAIGGANAAANPARAGFEALIDAREFDLAGRAPASLAELEAYCAGTSSQLLWLAAEMLGARGEGTREALRPVGIAWALTGLVRAIPFHARARRQYIPADIAAATGLTEEALFSLKPSAELHCAAAELAACAERHLASISGRAERAARPLMLMATLARAYLHRLRRSGHEVTERPVEISPVAKIIRLWWAAWTGVT